MIEFEVKKGELIAGPEELGYRYDLSRGGLSHLDAERLSHDLLMLADREFRMIDEMKRGASGPEPLEPETRLVREGKDTDGTKSKKPTSSAGKPADPDDSRRQSGNTQGDTGVQKGQDKSAPDQKADTKK